MTARIGTHAAWQVVGGEGIVLDLVSGNAIGLNPTATFILRLLEKYGADEIAERLALEFTVDLESARRDVAAFVEALARRGLVEIVP